MLSMDRKIQVKKLHVLVYLTALKKGIHKETSYSHFGKYI